MKNKTLADRAVVLQEIQLDESGTDQWPPLGPLWGGG